MSQSEVVEAVRDFAGPLGPFRSIDDHLAAVDGWVQDHGAALLDDLVLVAAAPPSDDALQPVGPENFRETLRELLSAVSERYPEDAVRVLPPYLSDPSAGPLVADALAATGSPAAVEQIAAYIDRHPRLPTDDLLPLVEAVGEIGGQSAQDLLTKIRSARGPDSPILAERIDALLT